MKEKKHLAVLFCSIQNPLELQCLIDDLVDFLGLSVFINVYRLLKLLICSYTCRE